MPATPPAANSISRLRLPCSSDWFDFITHSVYGSCEGDGEVIALAEGSAFNTFHP